MQTPPESHPPAGSPSPSAASAPVAPASPAAPGPAAEQPGPWRWIGVALGPLAALAIALIPSGLHDIPGYGHRPAYAAAVVAWMALWWLLEAVPITVTACLPLVLYPLLGVFGKGPVRDMVSAVEPFADAYTFLFLGGMAIGAAMEQWGLHRRVALHIMRAIGTDPKRLLLGMLVATASVSLWISNTATAVMMVPIGVALLAQLEAPLGGKKLSHFGTALMLAVAYASNVGGMGTKIGTTVNSIFCGFVADKMHRDVGFLEYIVLAFPFVVIFIPLVWWVLWRIGRRDDLGAGQARETLDRELEAMGAMSGGERKVAAVFLGAAALWIAGDPLRKAIAPHVPALWEGFKLQGKHYEATVAMLAMLVLLALGALSRRAVRGMSWGTLVLLGGSFAMASGIEGSGLGGWMAHRLAVVSSLPPFGQIGLASLGTVALSAVASNTATANIAFNVLPRDLAVLFATCMAASCDFMLPAGTPPNAIVFGSGYVRLSAMIKAGFFLDLCAVALITVYVYGYARHLLGG